jgi:hypothetical protein
MAVTTRTTVGVYIFMTMKQNCANMLKFSLKILLIVSIHLYKIKYLELIHCFTLSYYTHMYL